MSSILSVCWTISALHAPRPWLHCSHCGTQSPFQSSDKIRVNANGKRLDIWLIYRCVICGNSWNRPIMERTPIHAIDPAQLQRLMSNNRETARHLAFDLASLQRQVKKIEEFSDMAINKTVLNASANAAVLEITCALQKASIRLDRLLATELNLPRNQVQAMTKAGHIVIQADGKRPLRRPVHNGMRIRVALPEVDDADALITAATGGNHNQL
ncbi:DUF1062 domain-containing protein [Aestuariispira ectoiniformans]|uniref:DUF1062 domain-containing protein n=1 Tax=Aestuariispira ectoiniformans TaxID=2775080 RepID=UPI00223A854C|nr:DUF1062 domain-containing protein [Aestuariispira ectoiniformans]